MTFLFSPTNAINGDRSMGFDSLCKKLVYGEMLGVAALVWECVKWKESKFIVKINNMHRCRSEVPLIDEGKEGLMGATPCW